MAQLLSMLVEGASLGAVYALVALGIVVVYKSSSVVNFAQPSLLMFGTYVLASAYTLHGLSFWVALPLGVAAAAVLAVLIDRLLVSRFRKTHAVVAASIMTIGLDVVLLTETDRRIGSQILTTGDPWGNAVVRFLGIGVAEARIAALVVGALLLVLFQLWLHRSDFGVAMRATAEDPETASLMGIRLGRVSATAWAVAGALAVCAGLFIVAYPSPGLDTSVEAVALRALPAAIIGGLDSTTGAIAGGLLVGLSEVLVRGYGEYLTFLGQGFEEAAPYVLMLVVLLIRPAGLFGIREAVRV
ncbi:branched-chain amino acid ABC transporter permease [Streptosporangium sp. NPDC000239]|uniref:Branched-chain amino acid ABC transporter permease n=1 Tax=Streptosporangium jomthongense TaxID=1193683 RepID=A0ABV8EU58_9ACTN